MIAQAFDDLDRHVGVRLHDGLVLSTVIARGIFTTGGGEILHRRTADRTKPVSADLRIVRTGDGKGTGQILARRDDTGPIRRRDTAVAERSAGESTGYELVYRRPTGVSPSRCHPTSPTRCSRRGPRQAPPRSSQPDEYPITTATLDHRGVLVSVEVKRRPVTSLGLTPGEVEECPSFVFRVPFPCHVRRTSPWILTNSRVGRRTVPRRHVTSRACPVPSRLLDPESGGRYRPRDGWYSRGGYH